MSKDNEGEGWKPSEGEGDSWNSPERIATREYSSIIHSFYESVLRSVVQGRQRIDRDALDMIVSELDVAVTDKGFDKLPFRVQNSYKSLLKLANTLKGTNDALIEEHRDVLEGHFLLGINCHVYGSSMSTSYKGTNPCRDNQVQMYSALAKARRNAEGSLISLPILEASGQMFDVCKRCPFK